MVHKRKAQASQKSFRMRVSFTGTQPSISARENRLTAYAQTLVNCTLVEDGTEILSNSMPVVRCNRVVTSLQIPEFFDAEDLEVAPVRSFKRYRGCKDCNFRNAMTTREKQAVVRRVEDPMENDEVNHSVKVTYTWTEDAGSVQ